MNPIVTRIASSIATTIISTVISYAVIVTTEHTVEGIRRWYHNRKEQKSSN